MARRKNTIVVPATFVGTVYDHATGVYVATRKDGTVTFGKFNERGTNLSIVRGPSEVQTQR